jgi:hypothetical protein
MASFNFTNAMLDEGTAFTFGSWVCIADQVVALVAIAETRELTASAPASCRDVDDFAEDLGGICFSDLIGNLVDESGSNPSPTRGRLKFSSCHNGDAPSSRI